MKKRVALPLLLSSFILHPSAFPQGSLTPPGPPAPTMKTLDQVEARTPLDAAHTPGDVGSEFVIAQAGSYYLTGNLSVTKSSGIRITAAGVTVDLNGFQIVRASGSGDGITVSQAATSCTIRNGSISGFLDAGILAQSDGGAITHVMISDCNVGLIVSKAWRIDYCNAHDNTNDGISTGDRGMISFCIASNNGGRGIVTINGSTIVDCTASGNQGSAGISAGLGCTLAHCTATDNTNASGSSAGISTGNGCTVTACTAARNTSTNATPTGVTGAGITVGSASNVQNCSAFLNKGDGIRASNDCNIIANVCSTNGNGGDGAGVHVFFGNSRIEGNNVTNNDRGIEVGFAGNLIIKNSARVNGTGSAGNYVIAADNRYGPIIDDTAAGSIAASGKGPFTSTLTTTDPWANFSY